MRVTRYILWGLVIITAAAMAYLYLTDGKFLQQSEQANARKLGGEFSLLRHDGTTITDKDLLGKPHAMFFGFTNCPEVCPTTLYEMSLWFEELGEDANRIDAYFMSVDPERDTVEALFEYLSSFDVRITGITGNKSDVEKTLRSYKVFFNRVDLEDGDYNMDHTASIYLLNARGEFVRSISYGEDAEAAVEKLKITINGG